MQVQTFHKKVKQEEGYQMIFQQLFLSMKDRNQCNSQNYRLNSIYDLKSKEYQSLYKTHQLMELIFKRRGSTIMLENQLNGKVFKKSKIILTQIRKKTMQIKFFHTKNQHNQMIVWVLDHYNLQIPFRLKQQNKDH